MYRAIALLLVVASAMSAFAADVENSADHPLIPRYEGSEIVRYEHREFAEYPLMTDKATTHGGIEANSAATLPLEGEVTRISYRAPAERSALEVFRNYGNALEEAGFEPIFTCEKAACGGRNFSLSIGADELYMMFGEYDEEQRYLAARLDRPEGDVYVAVYAVLNRTGGGPNKDRTMVQLDVVEMEPMEDRMVVLDAGALRSEIAAAGSAAVYGILFDFDSAEIKPESKPQLDEIATFLREQSDLDVLIVGHTDAKGALDYNRDLAARRANAVVDALTSDYAISADRLTPVGVGMAAPIASNRTEDGRAKNRRVEIVER